MEALSEDAPHKGHSTQVWSLSSPSPHRLLVFLAAGWTDPKPVRCSQGLPLGTGSFSTGLNNMHGKSTELDWHQVDQEGKQKHCACTMNLHVSQVAYASLHPVLSFVVGRSRALKAATSILMCAGEAQSLGRWVILPGAVPGWEMCPAAGSPAGCSAAASQRCQWTSPWRAHYSCLDISHTPSRQRFHLW